MLETIWEKINPYIFEMLATILTTIASYVGLKIKKLYEKRVNTETKKEIVKSVVEMIEQVAKKNNWNSVEKHDQAKKNVVELLNKEGIKITELELEVLIESVCKGLKQGIS